MEREERKTKFQESDTRDEMLDRLDKEQKRKQGSGSSGKTKKRPITIIEMDGKKIATFAKGGRAGYRMGGKCKLAMKGKGRAYGKNS
jgi:hypothetical protein